MYMLIFSESMVRLYLHFIQCVETYTHLSFLFLFGQDNSSLVEQNGLFRYFNTYYQVKYQIEHNLKQPLCQPANYRRGPYAVYFQFVRTYKTVHVAVRVMLHDIPGYSIYQTNFYIHKHNILEENTDVSNCVLEFHLLLTGL